MINVVFEYSSYEKAGKHISDTIETISATRTKMIRDEEIFYIEATDVTDKPHFADARDTNLVKVIVDGNVVYERYPEEVK